MSISYYLTRSVVLVGMAAFFIVLGGTLGNGVDRAYQMQAQTTIPTAVSKTECYILFDQSPDSPPATMPAECEQYVDDYYYTPLTESECFVLFDKTPDTPPSTLPQECEQYVDDYYYTPLTESECYALFDTAPDSPPADIPAECEVYVDTYYVSVTADPVSEGDCYALFDELQVTAQDDASGLGDCEQYLGQYFESKRYIGSAPACPFEPDTDVTIVDYTEYGTRTLDDLVLRADGSEAEATLETDTYLPSGLYNVSFASYDPHRTYVAPDSFYEQWKILLYYENGERGVVTPPSRDIGSTEELVKERVAVDFEVPQAATYMIAQHAAFPSNDSHRFVPLCAEFKRVGDFEAEVEESATPPDTGADTTETSSFTAEAVSDEVENSANVATIEASDTSDVDDTANNEAEDSATRSDSDTAETTLRYEECPISPQEGRTLVDHTKGGAVSIQELALSNTEAAVRSAVYLTPRDYIVTTAVFVDVAQGSSGSWQTVLFNASGAQVGVTGGITAGTSQNVQVSTLSRVTVSDFAVRALPRRTSVVAGIVAPLCTAFDPVASTIVDTTPAQLDTQPASDVVTTKDVEPGSEGEMTESDLQKTVDDSTEQTPAQRVPQEVGVIEQPLVQAGGGEDVVQQVAQPRSDDSVRTLSDASPKQRTRVLEERVQTGELFGEADQVERISVIRPLAARAPDVSPIAVENERTMLKARPVAESAKDNDGDGVSDHDEVHLYGTDPYNAYTAGGQLSDGERILLGLDPHVPELVPVAVESAREKEPVLAELFTVEDIAVVEPDETDVRSGIQSGAKALRVQGTAPPNSFVTLYIYSTPIVVTVRADGAGRFEYTFDETLEDGTHTIYVATVNERGSIVAQSTPVPFVQTAQAATLAPAGDARNPMERTTPLLVGAILLIVLTVVTGGLVGIGLMHAKEDENVV